MFINHLDDLLAILGMASLLSGLYLWLGLPAPLILGGLALLFVAVRLDIREQHHGSD